ncbi:DeoR family transcriptional regulator [Streptomonospora sp. S1-112]|uniref:DeoR family transcriptional regulator n=1 Tax=Streptomonospora mangrovi TaxID=2883123 RepID=A0A9X3NTE3_9ACTN|nr:DeoR family transcriptional regulator [Streptomonospora mangrovi]MDA0567856.1 DeoR family transcriptional regulator [Streptomonospora mangrovi]
MAGRTKAAARNTVGRANGCSAVASPAPAPAPRPEPAAPPGERIAAAALAELPEHGVVLLDAGPLSEDLARALPPGCDLTVVTNSMAVAVELMGREDVTVLLIGGRIRAGATATVCGGSGMPGLKGLHVDVAFMTAGGVDGKRGLTANDPVEAAAKRMMMRVSDRVVVLATDRHVGHVALARYGTMQDLDCLITDSACDTPAGRRVAVSAARLVRV